MEKEYRGMSKAQFKLATAYAEVTRACLDNGVPYTEMRDILKENNLDWVTNIYNLNKYDKAVP